jgi:positive regulator of sigma E activity
VIEKGFIKKILPDNKAEVSLASAGCQSCQGCMASQSVCEERKIVAENAGNHKVGDEVEVEVPPGTYYRVFFLVFLLPLIFLILSIYIFQLLKISEVFSLFLALVIFLFSYYFANRYDKKLKKEICYRIIG